MAAHSNILAVKERKKVNSFNRVRLFARPWTVAYQAPPSMEFSRREYWSRLPLLGPFNVLNSHVSLTAAVLDSTSLEEPVFSSSRIKLSRRQNKTEFDQAARSALSNTVTTSNMW